METHEIIESVIATVLIPVRNGEKFLSDSIESCITQSTNFNFEVLIINDHSIDSTFEIAAEISRTHPQVRVLNNPLSGVGSALQFGLINSKGKYVLRLDSDDVMEPGRIDSQIKFMENNPDFVLLGSQISLIGDHHQGLKPNYYPVSNKDILGFMRKGNAFADPSVILRKDAALALRGIKNYLNGAEQYDFWLRLSLLGKVANSEAVLTKYRIHAAQFTSSRSHRVFFATMAVQVMWILGISQFHTARDINQSNFELQNERVSRAGMFFYSLINIKNERVAKARRGN